MQRDKASRGRLYLDAYGEPGRTTSSLPVYAVCIVWIMGSDADVEVAFANMRAALGLRKQYELHARKLTKRESRTQFPYRVFEFLLADGLRFECWCPVMTKSKSQLPPELAGKALLQELVKQALLRLPEAYVAQSTLTFDEQTQGKKVSKSAQELRTAANAALRASGRNYGLGRVIPKPAHQCAGLQLADFLAAAIAEPWPDCLALFSNDQVHTWKT